MQLQLARRLHTPLSNSQTAKGISLRVEATQSKISLQVELI
jgi:hypothetical protein